MFNPRWCHKVLIHLKVCHYQTAWIWSGSLEPLSVLLVAVFELPQLRSSFAPFLAELAKAATWSTFYFSASTFELSQSVSCGAELKRKKIDQSFQSFQYVLNSLIY